MTELLTAAQMRAIEQAAIKSGDVSGLELMERAGRGVVEAVFEEWPKLARSSHRAVVLCGPGNNGGDGFVVARLLKEWGWSVDVFLYGDPAKLPPDARANHDRWLDLGSVDAWHEDHIATCDADLFVDAVFGAGLTRAPSDDILAPLNELFMRGESLECMVAVDAPSGLCMDSGKPLSPSYGAVYADLTVTFHQMRPGHVLNAGPDYCGKVVTKSIGLAPLHDPASIGFSGTPSIAELGKWTGDHKYDNGHALVLSGGSGKGGAGRLAARGALRIGAGLVTLGCPPDALHENAAQLNAVMLTAVHDADALERVLRDSRINALCLGPGLGNDRARDLVPVTLEAKRAAVLDADALTAFQDCPEKLFSLLHDKCVLTPHAGEFACLFPDIAEKLNAPASVGPAYSKADATREAATRAGCVVLFKGTDSVTADPSRSCTINAASYARAAPWLATAGSGDVLAGFVTGLMARGFPAHQAAETAAWLHVEGARMFGPGLIAEDLPETLPRVFADLGL